MLIKTIFTITLSKGFGRLPLQRGKLPNKGLSWVWHKNISSGEAAVLEFLGMLSYLFIAITPSFTLT